MTLRLHNTLTGRVEPFEPKKPGEVRMYVCGITPYDVCHLGHARCYVVFDMVRRVLRANGFKVRFVQNFTDVDDKIIARAAERGVTTTDLVQQNIDDFYNKMDALGIQRADIYPRVTEHISDIIAVIQTLEKKGAAYRGSDGVYYSVRQFKNYGKLSKRPIEELILGARVEVNKEKRDPLDFALWKTAKPGEPAEATWDSPWGKGRPGWHIECSVMSLKHLGANFDIHGGGLDLIFPHHENEIAQSEAATGQPFATYWMHNGFVTVNREKMSKSLGNFFTLTEIFEKYHPSVVRYMLLSVHYRSPLDFSQDILDQSRQTLAGLKDAIGRATRVLKKQTFGVEETDKPSAEVADETAKLLSAYSETLSDDFNTPEALGILHKLVRLLEKQFAGNSVQSGSVRHILSAIQKASGDLGLDLFPSTRDLLIPHDVSEMAHQRQEARANRDWKEADRLRTAILERGYIVEDTSQGPRILPKALT